MITQSKTFITRSAGASLGRLWLGAAGAALLALPATAQHQPAPQYQYQYQAPTQYQATPAISQTNQGRPASIADLVELISPGVVNIKVTTAKGEVTSEGQGSGFVISGIGEVVTNYHVIEGGDKIDVVFNNGTSFRAQVIGTDEETDLALLKISSPQLFPEVPFYKGPPIRIGDWVIAIGNPFGIGQSTSLGIISAIGREYVDSGSYVDYIQTDATINRGNSGGPLFNPQGQVVGVNSAIFSPTGASVGIAFSIPHHTAENVINALRRDGRVRRGWLGAGLRTAELTGGKYSGGAIVDSIVPGSPANLYGLQIDDVILQINGNQVENSVEATRLIGDFQPGQQANLMIERAERVQNLGIQITERPPKEAVERAKAGGTPSYSGGTAPAPAARPGAMSGTGLSLVDLSSSFRRSIGMRHDQVGVYVESVAAGAPAARKGIESNMVLLEADQQPIASVRTFRDILAKAKQNNVREILLLVRTINGSENYVSLPI